MSKKYKHKKTSLDKLSDIDIKLSKIQKIYDDVVFSKFEQDVIFLLLFIPLATFVIIANKELKWVYIVAYLLMYLSLLVIAYRYGTSYRYEHDAKYVKKFIKKLSQLNFNKKMIICRRFSTIYTSLYIYNMYRRW